VKEVDNKIQANIVSDYLTENTNKIIASKYNLHRTTIQRILLRNNIALKKQNETARKHQIINENYFENINTEEKAYILGLLYADGYINNNGFGITLMEIDKELLEKISNIIYGKIVLGYRKSKNNAKPQYRFEVVSQKMKNDLIEYGCVKTKTFKIRLPELDNDILYQHFIRGYFDGDGCLCIPTNKPKNITFTITSNVDFCDGLANYVRNVVGVNMKSCVRYKDIGITRLTGGHQVRKFMNWLYKDATIYMKRKFEKYNKINTK
jgi:intein/homing endonuclease